MPGSPEIDSPNGAQVQPPWANPDLPPDQFLYDRLGPWPQPAPAYSMTRPPEVLNIPTVEAVQWDETIGARYVETIIEYTGPAYLKGEMDLVLPLPDDGEFVRIMTRTVYSRFLRREAPGSGYWISDFTAMELITPLPQMYCAPVVCRFLATNNHFFCSGIQFLKTDKNKELMVRPGDKAWNLAKAYALQGAPPTTP